VVIFAHLLYLVLERLRLPGLIILVRVVKLFTETRIIYAELQTDSFELLLAPIFLLFVALQVLSHRFEILSVCLLGLLVESVQVQQRSTHPEIFAVVAEGPIHFF